MSDRITVIEPNGVERTRPITAQGLTIGRGSDNGLALGYAAVSRNHAQVMFDGGRYYVIDLNSANGTYLGDYRLEPHTPTVWGAGQMLRIGDVLVRLEQTAGATYEAEPIAEPMTGPRTRTEEDTMIGVPAREAQKPKEKSRSLSWVIVALLIFLFWVIAGVVAYYLLF